MSEGRFRPPTGSTKLDQLVMLTSDCILCRASRLASQDNGIMIQADVKTHIVSAWLASIFPVWSIASIAVAVIVMDFIERAWLTLSLCHSCLATACQKSLQCWCPENTPIWKRKIQRFNIVPNIGESNCSPDFPLIFQNFLKFETRAQCDIVEQVLCKTSLHNTDKFLDVVYFSLQLIRELRATCQNTRDEFTDHTADPLIVVQMSVPICSDFQLLSAQNNRKWSATEIWTKSGRDFPTANMDPNR